jgi:hypothetical protein
MHFKFHALAILLLAINLNNIFCVQLTFELPDNAVQCFYERISKDTNTVLEFQVNNFLHFSTQILKLCYIYPR